MAYGYFGVLEQIRCDKKSLVISTFNTVISLIQYQKTNIWLVAITKC